jgi:tRNA A-37 threonylcarbamoyl transferase component Bud32/tetratricopeptide (TPR) repeat protein
MTAERWKRIHTEFARVQEADEAERPALLASLDPDIRTDVMSLLAALGTHPDFLVEPGAPPLGPGGAIGPYRLVEEVGRGGMGVVFRAERQDGEFQREVAIKMTGGRLAALEAERRFVRERQILAGLDHPHIVRLLDGGVVDRQRYFVMEFVRGMPITDYCRAPGLTARERLSLFRALASAIQYAHQRLILHRDLKPSNVLVTTEGVVKVLDFGIAQILDDGTSAGTATHLHPYSLGYASPEQLRGEPLSLATDVYALGVLLFEMLSGRNPQHQPGDTFDDTYRRIMATDPPSIARVTPSVGRDLDVITRKALARRPEDRYASAAEFDADLGRWIEGRPIRARAPSWPYIAGRFVSRHRALTALSAGLVLALGIGAAVYVGQARVEERRFEDARRLVHTVIFQIQPELEKIPATLELRKTLIEETMRYLEAVSADAGRNVGLLLELSNAYQQLARVQGDVTTTSLGNQSAAVARFGRAEALMARAVALDGDNPAVLKDAALLFGRLAGFASGQGRPQEAARHAASAVSYAERNLARRPGEFDAREILALAVFYIGVASPADDWDGRVAAFTRAGDLYRGLASERPDREGLTRNAGINDRYVASLLHDRGRAADARARGEAALDASTRLLSRRPADPSLQLEVATDSGLLATCVDATGDVRGAERHFARAIELLDGVLAADPANARATLLAADALRNFARNRLHAGDLTGARRRATRALQLFDALQRTDRLPEGTRWRVASALAALGDIERAANATSASCQAYRQALTAFDAADALAPLVDRLKQEADRTRAHAAEARCEADASPRR